MIRLVIANKSTPTELEINEITPVAMKESTIRDQMPKPTIDAPTKKNVARLS